MLKVALVGAGGMASTYRAVYGKLPNVEWTLAVDIDARQLDDCKALGAKRVSTRFEDALSADIDVIDISTPNHMHEEQAVAALKAGKHVLLQKPMANSLRAAENILAVSLQSKGFLGMYMSSYTQPENWDVRRMIEQGAFGSIQSVRARTAHRGGLSTQKDKWRANLEKTGGGCFIQLSIHTVNLLQWWLNSPMIEICAYSTNQYCPNIPGDDLTTAIVKFENGCCGVLDSGWASEGYACEVYGTKGYLKLLGNSDLMLKLDGTFEGEAISYTTPGKIVQIPIPHVSLDDVSNPHNQQRLFLEHIQAGKAPLVTGVQGRNDLAVIMAGYESAKIGMPVKIKHSTASVVRPS